MRTRSWRPGVPAEATGRAAPTAVGEPETKAYLRVEREVRIPFPPADSPSLSGLRVRSKGNARVFSHYADHSGQQLSAEITGGPGVGWTTLVIHC